MKIQLTHNFGCARGTEYIQWFDTLGDAQDWVDQYIKAYISNPLQSAMLEKVQDCNVKGLSNLLTGVNKFHFQWV